MMPIVGGILWMPKTPELATRVREHRFNRGWTQGQLADVCGIDIRTIQRIEAGQQPSLESLQAIAAAFGTDIRELRACAVLDNASAGNGLKLLLRNGSEIDTPTMKHLQELMERHIHAEKVTLAGRGSANSKAAPEQTITPPPNACDIQPPSVPPSPAILKHPANLDVEPAGKPLRWNRTKKTVTFAIAVLTLLASWLVVPEFRNWLHLDKPASSTTTAAIPGAEPNAPREHMPISDSVTTVVRRAQPSVEFDFPSDTDKKQKLSLNVIPSFIRMGLGPTDVAGSALPMDVHVDGGTITVLKFGKDDQGGFVYFDTRNIPRGTRIRGAVEGYAELQEKQ